MLENSFTKQQYNNIRELNKTQYPSYNKVREAKSNCRPQGITVTETVAQVPLKDLLDHTVCRIILLREEIFKQFPKISNVKLIASYGFDGSTGQSMYKQKFCVNESQSFDQSLFATTVIPLKLVGDFGTVLWLNRTPQSVRFCRPLKLEFVKETKEHILTEKNDLDNQIQKLVPMHYIG